MRLGGRAFWIYPELLKTVARQRLAAS